MSLWKNTQHSFAAGQLDTHVMGRQDMDRYANGATLLKNFLVKRQGCISKRRGTDLTADLANLLGTDAQGNPIAPGKMRLVPVTNGDDGRYVILSGGVGFVASRDGIYTSDNRHVRYVRPYVAIDEDGKPIVVNGKDARRSTSKPVDRIRRLSSGNYKVNRYATLQAAFDAAADGDIVRLHDNILLTDPVTVTRSNSWKTDSNVSATVTWDGDHAGHPNQYKIVTGGSTYYSRESDYYGNRSKVTFMSGEQVVTVTESAKTVTLDFYGYKITTRCQYGFHIRNESVTLVVDSTRTGAKMSVVGSSGNIYGFNLHSRIDNVKSGSLHLKGNIAYDLLAGASNHWIVFASDTKGVTIDAGTFTAHDIYHCLVMIDAGPLVINGGKFINEITGNNYVYLIRLVRSTGRSQATSATINGGTFVNLNPHVSNSSAEYNAHVICNTNGSIVINGGRFTFASPTNFCASNAYRGQTYWSTGRLRIVRGEFSQSAIKNSNVDAEYGIERYTGDYGDTSSKTATEITFAMLGITATAGAWAFSDTSASLTCEWSTANDRWYIHGTNSQGRNVNEYVSGNPGDAEVTFPTCGITATRTWTFSDGGHWPIGFANGSWYVTTSVPNEVQPNDEGFYGVKVGGEGDYFWDEAAFADRPYRFAVPYADDDLADLCIRQSGDTLFIAHRDYPPAKIWFDSHGNAYFEELTFDNTDYSPPVIESAEMDGNDPKETDNWPAEFPRRKDSGDAAGDCITVDGQDWYVGGCPTWLSSTQKEELVRFRKACVALRTVTDAGYNGNDATCADDGTYSRACSYTCTSVSKNWATGKKTTTINVKSFTQSCTKEEKVNYVNGQAQGWFDSDTGQITLPSETRTFTTNGSAENSASATSVIVTRTVRYVATYVKDGKESRPSSPVAINYDMPWANNAVVNLTLGKGANDGEPEYYNVYKDNGNGYGLIATVGADRIAGGIEGGVDTYPLFMPDNTGGSSAIVCAADYEERKGWATGDIMRKMVSSGKDRFTTSPANDICLVNTASNASNGIEIEFPSAVRFDRIGVMLDGRIYDKARDTSYVLVSTNRVTCTVTYEKTDGTTGTTAKTETSPLFYSFGDIAGGSFYGVYEDWLSLPWRAFTAPNGDTIYGWMYGKGDCTDEFNSHLRRLNFDFASTFASLAASNDGFAGVKSIKFTFSESQYTYWTNNQQGCIHAIHFYSGADTGGSGVVQDDYINPDMTVTPPDNTQDAHFSAADEYPGCVGIYEQRLVFASSRFSPSTIWMSRIADLYNFTVHESIREDDALELTLAATEFPNINHLVMGRDLMLFGDGGEWLISPVSGNALTYKTASAKLQSMIGSDRSLQPLQLADETLFAERGGTCLRSINYNYTSDSYQSNDLSVIAQSLFRANAIVSMAYKQHPDSIVECVLKDGRVGTLVYMKEQEVSAWSVQELGGGWKAKEIATPKCIVDGTTEMMLLVEKNGAFQLWRVRNDNDEATDAVQVVLDGLHVERSDAAAGEGEVVVSLGNGKYAVGFPVVSEFVSVRPEPERGATAQMEIKNATESEIRVIGASTFKVKPYAIDTGWRQVPLPVVRDGSAVTLAEKDCKRLLTGTNNRDGRIHVKHDEPWPLTILSISNTYQVEYENGDGKGDGQ